jgi:hypothetical protein
MYRGRITQITENLGYDKGQAIVFFVQFKDQFRGSAPVAVTDQSCGGLEPDARIITAQIPDKIIG